MSTRKIKNKWYADFRYQGKRYRIKSPIDTKNGAQEIERTTFAKLIRGETLKPVEVKQEVGLKSFFFVWFESYVKANNRFSEVKSKKSIFTCQLIPFFGDMSLKDITNKKVEQYKAKRMKSVSVKTLRNEISMLSTCLKAAVEWEYLDAMPLIKMPKVPQCGFKWLPEKDCERLLRTADGMLKDMIFLALKTGLRFGELIALTWPDFDFDHKRLTINKSVVLGICGPTKSGKIRYVPLTDSVCEYFGKLKQKDGLVFQGKDGGFLHHKIMNYCLGKIYAKAGLRPTGWHAFRHTFASHLACKGASILAIKELLGHSDLKTSLRYSHLGPNITTETMHLLL